VIFNLRKIDSLTHGSHLLLLRRLVRRHVNRVVQTGPAERIDRALSRFDGAVMTHTSSSTHTG